MTADYSEMSAGPELDALVAEKVMGLAPLDDESVRLGDLVDRSGEYLVSRTGKEVTMESDIARMPDDTRVYASRGYGGAWITLAPPRHPPYSTDIAAAWRVVGRLAGEYADVAVYALSDGTYDCRIGERNPGGDWGGDEVHADAETAPLAICRAALIATESEPKE